jgi:protein-tyrosine kinase
MSSPLHLQSQLDQAESLLITEIDPNPGLSTAGCGKSVTACNLAVSIARLTEKSVLLVDMDLQKPKVAEYLGLKFGDGLLSVLEGHSSLSNVIVQANIGRTKMLVLPGEV